MSARARLAAVALVAALAPSRTDDGVREAGLRADIGFLASDALQGRKAGEWGSVVAQGYLAARFAEIGLEPMGDGGGYLQRFTFAIRDVGDCALTISRGGERREAEPRESFLPLVGSPNGAFDGEAVFVGYGITAPECAWDDYAGVDVKGRVAVALRHEPFASDESAAPWLGARFTRHAFFAEKARNAAKHGAVALVVVPDLASFPKGRVARRMPGRRFWRSTSPMGGFGAMASSSMPDEELRKHNISKDEIEDEIFWAAQAQDSGLRLAIPSLFVAADASASLLDAEAAEKEILDARAPRSRALAGVRVSGKIEITATAPKETANVVGRLKGSDPALASEFVVVGAHYDHVGMNAEGEVWNGADDNASGCAAILAIAESLRAARPKRPVIFVAFGAEEVALLGSYYFVANPPVPLASIVAMVNCDMIGRGGEEDMKASPEEASGANEVLLCGLASSPGFEPLVKEENAGIDLEIRADDRFFDRSDQAGFYDAGIPVLFFNTGEHGDYHGPNDTADRIHYDKAVRVTRLVLRCVRRVADGKGAIPFVDYQDAAGARANASRHGLLGAIPFLERADL